MPVDACCVWWQVVENAASEGDVMCGRTARQWWTDYYDLYGVEEFSETAITPRFNIAPTQSDFMIRAEDGTRRLVASRWGLVPTWAKDRSIASKMFNARAETLVEKPAFRSLVARHRCIIPISGFYEWKREGTKKQPLYIHAADGHSLALAGLWTTWTDPEREEPITSHTVITCAPNGFMEAIHNRMPVILDREGVDLWLDAETVQPADVLGVLGPCPVDVLTAYPVSTLVNNVRNQGPGTDRTGGVARLSFSRAAPRCLGQRRLRQPMPSSIRRRFWPTARRSGCRCWLCGVSSGSPIIHGPPAPAEISACHVVLGGALLALPPRKRAALG
jgi:putative SOS response-associated peptidase YedK